MEIQKIKKEKKFKQIIGVARLYDHSKLIPFLESIGIDIADEINAIKTFAEKFNYETRTALLRAAPAGMVMQEIPFENITPTVGFQAITKALSGNLSDPEEMEVMVHAFGSDGTTPSLSDTALGTETVRKLLSSKSYSGAKAYYTAFYGLTEGNGTHAEMGLFIDADDATPDDGVLWDRSLISITKTSVQSLTIDYQDTFVNN